VIQFVRTSSSPLTWFFVRSLEGIRVTNVDASPLFDAADSRAHCLNFLTII
jgi:hypothetical protein